VSYLRYLCLLTHSGVHTYCVVFLFCFSSSCVPYPMVPFSLDCPFLIASSVFSNVYLQTGKIQSNLLMRSPLLSSHLY
jgi:hypothetical protein